MDHLAHRVEYGLARIAATLQRRRVAKACSRRKVRGEERQLVQCPWSKRMPCQYRRADEQGASIQVGGEDADSIRGSILAVQACGLSPHSTLGASLGRKYDRLTHGEHRLGKRSVAFFQEAGWHGRPHDPASTTSSPTGENRKISPIIPRWP